ncbi:electron transfer flavoprotein subunit beta/FixA family protein [Oceanisphaera psychrotolerans]|uniref:Electron transfer flavoprotein subunit beta n=1 Tax=Oceanisphaera psychrotolerans TaxID=1414654 RepID=A0A1J4QGH4_9GAMM|nr:electron transfer flavoprotein subunit beta [Oceanisphaera psychrotolerans]OIN09171.1 electron transfer flavoprotein subunit beta [Oceanisphaera psychrotolerans]
MQPETLNIAVLVSQGQHPVSGRARRAHQDACALELALSLPQSLNGKVSAIHAGDPDQDALRDYLGMGIDGLTVLNQTAEDDALTVLYPYLSEQQPDILLTGVRAEYGEGSGLLPYLLAERMGWPLVTGIAAIESIENDEASLLQALPRGQRRRIKVRLPFVASVESAAAEPRQIAFAKARRGNIARLTPATEVDQARTEWTLSPAKPRPKRLKVSTAKTAADRFKQATAKAQGGKGQIIRDDPQAAAKAIYDLLVEEGVLRK